MTTICYRRLNLFLSPKNEIYNDFESFDYKHVDVPGKVYDKSFTFKQCKVPQVYFANEPIYKIILELQLVPVIFLIEPGFCYNWHRDAWRNIAFNTMLTSDPNYYVAFAPDHPLNIHHRELMYTRTEEVRYESNRFILFNTQVPHISINQGNVPRYLLTIAPYNGKPSELSHNKFNDVVDYLDKKSLLA